MRAKPSSRLVSRGARVPTVLESISFVHDARQTGPMPMRHLVRIGSTHSLIRLACPPPRTISFASRVTPRAVRRKIYGFKPRLKSGQRWEWWICMCEETPRRITSANAILTMHIAGMDVPAAEQLDLYEYAHQAVVS